MILTQGTPLNIADDVIESLRNNVIPYHFLGVAQQRAITLLSASEGYQLKVRGLDQTELRWVKMQELFTESSTYDDQRFVIFRLVGNN